MSAISGSKAAKAQERATIEAARIQAAQADKALAEYRRQSDRAWDAQQPWVEAGEQGLGQLLQKVMAGPGEYTQSPGYEFRLNEGLRGVENSGLARGAGGNTLEALNRYGQDYATGDYDNFLTRYYQSLSPFQSLAGLGQTSAGMQSNVAMQTGQYMGDVHQNLGNALAQQAINQGNARAQGYMNMSQGIQDIIGGGLGLAGLVGFI